MVFIYLIYLKKNTNYELFESPTNIIEGLDVTSTKPKFTIDLVKLNPMFSKRKFIIKDVINNDGSIQNGVLTNVENTDWKQDFNRKLCMGCSCFNPKVYTKEDKVLVTNSLANSPSNSPSNSLANSMANSPLDYDPLLPNTKYDTRNVQTLVEEERRNCGFRMDGNEYQCAKVCPQCNICHKDESSIQTKYLDKCNIPKESEDIELCKYYRDKVKFVKDACVFPDKLNNVIVNDRECFSFYSNNDNRYYINDKVIFKLKTDKNVDLIDIYQVFYRNKKNRKINIKPIIFYTNNNEAYFYINTKNLVEFEGNIQLFFVLNITYLGEKARYDDKKFIEVKRKMDYIKRYENILDGEKKQVYKDVTFPADYDLYNLNYLEESKSNPKQIVNNYSVKNEVTDYEIGEFKRFEYKDNPETWMLRSDINRPWINAG